MNQARKKVLFLITKANWGGAQRYVFDLTTHIPRDRFEPVVAYGVHGTLTDSLTTAGVRTLQIPPLARDIAIVSDIKSFFEILRLLRSELPDVLHLNSSKAGALGAFAGRIAGVKKIIFTAHGWPFCEDRDILSRTAIWLVSWFTALCSTNVICVSEFDLHQAKRMPFVGKKSVSIYNGIDLHMQFGSGDVIRSKFPTGVKITGTIGELTKNKNQQALIGRARNDPTMYVAIVGDGEDRAKLESLIERYDLTGRVKFFGFIPASEALKGFDLFMLPSLKEGLPYVLLEARLAGLPIAAHGVGGVPEILNAKDLSEFSLERMVEQTIALY